MICVIVYTVCAGVYGLPFHHWCSVSIFNEDLSLTLLLAPFLPLPLSLSLPPSLARSLRAPESFPSDHLFWAKSAAEHPSDHAIVCIACQAQRYSGQSTSAFSHLRQVAPVRRHTHADRWLAIQG